MQPIAAARGPELSLEDEDHIRTLFNSCNVAIAEEWNDESKYSSLWTLTFNIATNNMDTDADRSNMDCLMDKLHALKSQGIKFVRTDGNNGPYSYNFEFYKYNIKRRKKRSSPSVDKYTLAGWYFDQDQSSLYELAEYCGVDYDDDMETDDVLDQITDEQFVDYILQSEFAEAFYDEFA